MVTKLLSSYCGTHLLEFYCKESNVSDTSLGKDKESDPTNVSANTLSEALNWVLYLKFAEISFFDQNLYDDITWLICIF